MEDSGVCAHAWGRERGPVGYRTDCSKVIKASEKWMRHSKGLRGKDEVPAQQRPEQDAHVGRAPPPPPPSERTWSEQAW